MKQKRLSSSLLPSALALLLVLGACTQDEGMPAPQGADNGETPRSILQLSGVSLATHGIDVAQTRAEQELAQGSTVGVGVIPINGYSSLEWGQFTRQAGGTWTGPAIELGHDPLNFYMWYSPAGYLAPDASGLIPLVEDQKYDPNKDIYYRLMESNTDVTVFHPSPRIVLKSVYTRIKVNVEGLGTRPEKITLGVIGNLTVPSFEVKRGFRRGYGSVVEMRFDYTSVDDIDWELTDLYVKRASIDRLMPFGTNGVITRLIIVIPEGITWEIPLEDLKIKMEAGATYTINVRVGKDLQWKRSLSVETNYDLTKVNQYQEEAASTDFRIN